MAVTPETMKTSRRRSREFALQGLYQWQLAGTDPRTIIQQLSEAEGYAKIDTAYFKLLLEGAVAGAPEREALITPLLIAQDRLSHDVRLVNALKTLPPGEVHKLLHTSPPAEVRKPILLPPSLLGARPFVG